MAGRFTPSPGGQPQYTQSQSIQRAAIKYDIPQPILYGVWGIETDFGRNVKSSSAGAVGDFQFLPSTARQYGYPLTNSPSSAQFGQQADATARYLSDLYKQHGGSWDAALRAYSGGGYGLAQVQQKWGSAPGGYNPNNLPGPNPSDIPNPLAPITDVAGAISSVWSALTSPSLWKRVLYFVGGAVFLFWGIKELTGAQVPEGVKHAAMAAAV